MAANSIIAIFGCKCRIIDLPMRGDCRFFLSMLKMTVLVAADKY